MTSEPIRDPLTDSRLTAQNAALVVIDHQPSQNRSCEPSAPFAAGLRDVFGRL